MKNEGAHWENKAKSLSSSKFKFAMHLFWYYFGVCLYFLSMLKEFEFNHVVRTTFTYIQHMHYRTLMELVGGQDPWKPNPIVWFFSKLLLVII